MSILDNEGHDPKGLGNTVTGNTLRLIREEIEAPLRAEIERILRCVEHIEDELCRDPPRVGDALYVCMAARDGSLMNQ